MTTHPTDAAAPTATTPGRAAVGIPAGGDQPTPGLTPPAGPAPRTTMREPRITIINGRHESGDGYPPTMSEIDDEGACFMLRRELHELSVVARFTIDGEPSSKARPRFTKQGSKTQTYTPEKTLQAEQVIGWKFRAVAPGHKLDPDIAYGVMALFFSGTRQRRDVDNMLKLILDGLNGVAWPDDDQVTEVSARKTLTLRENARTEVAIYQVGLVQRNTLKCEHCGHDFATYQSTHRVNRFCSNECHLAWRQARKAQQCENCGETFVRAKPGIPQKHCSRACRDAATRVTLTCGHCGAEFTKQRRHVRAQNYCSTECQTARARERATQNAKGTCETCGGPTSKKTYRQCNACKISELRVTGKPQKVAA